MEAVDIVVDRLTPQEISEAYALLIEGFQRLGFKTIEDPVHQTLQGALGVYLIGHEGSSPAHDDAMWLRVQVVEGPTGQFAELDYRFTGNNWFTHRSRTIEKPEPAPIPVDRNEDFPRPLP
jgi:hypothetical protein